MTKKKVVITRPSGPYEGGSRFADKIRSLGFEPFEFPVLSCIPVPLTAEVIKQIAELSNQKRSSWVAFLSPSAIWAWKSLSQSEPLLESVVRNVSIAVQGSGTAAACSECFGRSPDFMPQVFVAEEFAKELSQVMQPGQRILVPQSTQGRDVLAPTLAASGFTAKSFSLYRLESAELPAQMLRDYSSLPHSETYVVFMSPSAVRAAVKMVGTTLPSQRLLSIGPMTSRAIREAGLKVWQEATEHSEEGVLEVLRPLLEGPG